MTPLTSPNVSGMSTTTSNTRAPGCAPGPAAAAAALERALGQLEVAESLLLDLPTPIELPDLHGLGRTLELVSRRAGVAQAAYAARIRTADEEARRSRGTSATSISEGSGCSRQEAYGHLGAAEALYSVAGDALRDLRLSRSQAAGVVESVAAFDGVLDPELIESTARTVIADAGRKNRSTIAAALRRALSSHLPTVDEESRDRHRHQSRSAKLGRPGPDGMARFSMYLMPQHRAQFEAAAAAASARAAKATEEAQKRGEEPEQRTFEQSLYDHLADVFARGMSHFPAPQPGAPSSPTTPAADSAHPTAGSACPTSGSACPTATADPVSTASLSCSDPATAPVPVHPGDEPPVPPPPVASVVIRIDPADLANDARQVLTNTGSLLSVSEALEMAASGPHFLSVFFGGRERLFRVDEIDPDRDASTARFATPVQRLVLFAAHDGCCWPGCDEPATRCQVHHVDCWDSGGPTAVSNLALVCRTHHNRIHGGSDGYSLQFDTGPPGDPPRPRWIPNSFGDDSACAPF